MKELNAKKEEVLSENEGTGRLEIGQEVMIAHPAYKTSHPNDKIRFVKGTIIYINREHHWFLAECPTDCGKGTLRQGYHFHEGKKQTFYK